VPFIGLERRKCPLVFTDAFETPADTAADL
jgi:hypothetical protein